MTNVVNIALPDSEAMTDRVVEEAARQLLTEWMPDPEDGTAYPQKSRLAQRIEDAVVEAIREQARSLVPQIAQEVLDRGVTPTDAYGFSVNREPKSVGRVIAETVIAELSLRKHGNYGANRTVLEDLIHKEVDQALRGELKGAIEEAKRVVTDAIADSAVTALKKAVVKSLPGVEF